MSVDVLPEHNLIDLPWLLVLDADGVERSLGLGQVFDDAPRIARVIGELPTQVFAIHRLLLAILHRAVGGPNSLDEWAAWRDDWPGFCAEVQDYLEHFRDRFFLVHPGAPFFQVAGLQTRKGPDDVASLDKLIADVPNGEPFFTTRLGRGLARIEWPEAARWLVHSQAYDAAGLRSGAAGTTRRLNPNGTTPPEGTGWCGQIGGLLAEGETLQETLLLNLIVYGLTSIERHDPRDDADPDERADVPCWERAPFGVDPRSSLGPERVGGEPTGPLDLFTWQSRRIRLVGDADGVTGLVLCAGDRISGQNQHVTEPMSAWRYSEPQSKKFGMQVYMPRTHDPSRSLWRGLASLLPQLPVGDAGRKHPVGAAAPVMTWLAALRRRGLLDDRQIVPLRAIGVEYGSNSSTVAEIVDDRLVLPAALLTEEATELHGTVIGQVKIVDDIAYAVGDFARNVAAAAGAGPDEAASKRDEAREALYTELDQPFRDWLADLRETSDLAAVTSQWHGKVREVAHRIRGRIVRDAPPTAFIGRSIDGKRHVELGLADRWLAGKLLSTLNITTGEEGGGDGAVA